MSYYQFYNAPEKKSVTYLSLFSNYAKNVFGKKKYFLIIYIYIKGNLKIK